MLIRAPYTLSFVLVVCCWFRHNAAIPFASRSSDASRSRMQHAYKDKETDSQRYDINAQSRAAKRAESSDTSFNDDDSADTIHNIIKNQNVNMNMNIFGRHKHRIRKPHIKENVTEEIQQPANCSSGKKENQRYSSSFGNVTSPLTVDNEIKDVVGNNSKAKTISSIHENEDITLCWIETVTIKENKTIRPPKRLVIREYTISFENSATIPDKYLECQKLEGELTTSDNEIAKTALFEVIDEDTKVSRVVNFTSVSHVGDIIVWQHRKVKCGVGPVVTKNIVTWNDGSKNPKKRVEIKVSPKLHQLTVTKPEDELCTENPAEDENGKSSSPTDATTKSCENSESGTCEVTTKTNDASISTEASEEITKSTKNVTSSDSEKDLSTSIGDSKPPTLPKEIFTSTVAPKIPTQEDILSCEEDPSCTTKSEELSSSEEEELSVESGATEVTTQISTTRKNHVTQRDTSNEEEPTFFPTEGVPRLVTAESTLFASTTETSITTSRSATEDEKEAGHTTSEEDSEDTSAKLSTKVSDKIDHVSFSSISTVTSDEISAVPDVTTTLRMSPGSEFTESEKFSKLSESTLTESLTTQSSTTKKDKESREIEESNTEKETSTSTFSKTTSSMETKPTALSMTSNEVDYSCENSDCTYISSSEACDESENCGSSIDKSCESGMCSDEDIIKDQPSDKIPLPTRSQTFVTDSPESSEESTTIKNLNHTTVASVATTIVTVQEAENSTVKDVRGSTTTSSTTPQHKFTLTIMVRLVHSNEKKETHNLVEVNKTLLLDENPIQDDHSDLLEQLKSLNDSVNRETLNALLNCTSLKNLTKHSNLVDAQSNDVTDNSYEESEYTNPSSFEDLISEQSTFDDILENQDSQYPDHDDKYDQEHIPENEIPFRRRRSLDDKIEDLDGLDTVSKNPIDLDKLTEALNVSELQNIHLTMETTHPSTTNNLEEAGTSDAAYIENERNITKEGNDSVTFSTIRDNDTDSSTLEYQAVNVTEESVQLSTTTSNPEEETSDIGFTENGNDTTTEVVLSTVIPLINGNVDNESKIDVVRQAISEIQQDIWTGLQQVMSELTQINLTSINDIKKAIKTNLLDIIANPKDGRIHSRVRRAAAEEIGHWANERIRKAPMGGTLRSFTEFTLQYNVFS